MDYIAPSLHLHQDSLAKHIVTVVGAGDHVIAATAIGMALEKPHDEILMFASHIAAIHIEQGITDNVTPIEPQTDWGIARQTIAAWQQLGLKVGFTNGCFDILHAGHVMYLNQAKQHCDRLVLGLNSDTSVRILKGVNRPINNEQDRKDVMMGLKAIDHVVFFGAENAGDDNTPTNVIAHLKPDIFFKGGDYTIDQLPEAKAVLSYGGEVKILGLLDGRSTTNIIAKSQKN
jgi:rfaE bifunctional protein nucleotidyltransferase chain/domain